jgi:hypothetical protein
MEQLDSLKGKIADFPGYEDDIAREKSDEMVRSYVGERLAALQDRLEPLDDATKERVGTLLLRAAFANQIAHKAYAGNERSMIDASAVAAGDVETIVVADRAPSVNAEQLEQYLNEISTMLDKRDAAMSGQKP